MLNPEQADVVSKAAVSGYFVRWQRDSADITNEDGEVLWSALLYSPLGNVVATATKVNFGPYGAPWTQSDIRLPVEAKMMVKVFRMKAGLDYRIA
jgi:hypothetical protein